MAGPAKPDHPLVAEAFDADMAGERAEARRCGECDACCVMPSINADTMTADGADDIGKPEGVPCRFLAGDGTDACCSIYDRRPRICHTYHCAWRRGFFAGDGDECRPDKSGVLVEVREFTNGSRLVKFTDTRIDGRDSPAAKAMLLIAAQRHVVAQGRLISNTNAFTGQAKAVIEVVEGMVVDGLMPPSEARRVREEMG